MLKIVGSAVSQTALLLFLILIGENCLRWYIIPISNSLHRILFAGMVCLSGASCLFALRNLMQVRRLWQRSMLKLLAASPEIETKLEAGVYYSSLSLSSALTFYTAAAVWGIIYYDKGPFIKAGTLALIICIAYNVTATFAGVKLERLKRSVKLKRTKV